MYKLETPLIQTSDFLAMMVFTKKYKTSFTKIFSD